MLTRERNTRRWCSQNKIWNSLAILGRLPRCSEGTMREFDIRHRPDMSSSLFYNVSIVFESILWFLSKSCANQSRIEHVDWIEEKIICNGCSYIIDSKKYLNQYYFTKEIYWKLIRKLWFWWMFVEHRGWNQIKIVRFFQLLWISKQFSLEIYFFVN